MKRVKEIVKEYEQADFFNRLCLFLQHRDLRDVFQKMENIDQVTERIMPSPDEKNINGFPYDVNKQTDFNKRRPQNENQ